jgi:hypothetical protein
VRRKAIGLPPVEARDYLGKHCAVTVHRKIELLMRNDPDMDDLTANLLIVRASELLHRRMLQRLAKERKAVAKAA